MEAPPSAARPGSAEADDFMPLPEPLCRAIASRRVRTILVCGGTFDPPHRAHVELPALARDRLATLAGIAAPDGRSAWLLYVPAARSPLKDEGPEASDEDRVAMLRLATAGLERAAVWTDEIDRGRRSPAQPSYTIDTIRRLERAAAACAGTSADAGLGEGHGAGWRVSLRLVIGSDQAAEFHRWRSPRDLIARAEPLVLLRAPNGGGAAAAAAEALTEAMARAGYWSPEELEAWRSRLAPVPLVDASATRVREAIRRAPADPAARQWLREVLAPEVLRYIETHRLYR